MKEQNNSNIKQAKTHKKHYIHDTRNINRNFGSRTKIKNLENHIIDKKAVLFLKYKEQKQDNDVIYDCRNKKERTRTIKN